MTTDLPLASVDVLRYFNVTRTSITPPSCENPISRLNESSHVMRLLRYTFLGRDENYVGETFNALDLCRSYLARDAKNIQPRNSINTNKPQETPYLPLLELPHVVDTHDSDILEALMFKRDLEKCQQTVKELERSNKALLNQSDIILRKWDVVTDPLDFTGNKRNILNEIND